MRILWVKAGGLWPLNSGGRLRSFHTVSELSRRQRVTVLTTHDPDEDPIELSTHLPHCERVVSFPHRAPKKGSLALAAALARSWLSELPVDTWKWRVPALRAEVFEHNVEHLIWKRLAAVERRPWRRLPLEVEWRKMRRWEARACARADLTIAVSEQDRDLLAEVAPGARVVAIPTGVDTSYFTPNRHQERAGALVFTGSMDWYPNEDGLVDFLEATLPLIRRQVPEASLTVVGRNPSTRLRDAAARAGVEVTGTVDDVRPYVARGSVYVVPLRVGGGTRLKIFEALAMGKPVVSTTVGAEGLPLVPGEHFLAADEPARFAGAVVSLLQDPVRRRALGAAGRRLVEERYSWPQVAREFESRFREVIPHA